MLTALHILKKYVATPSVDKKREEKRTEGKKRTEPDSRRPDKDITDEK